MWKICSYKNLGFYSYLKMSSCIKIPSILKFFPKNHFQNHCYRPIKKLLNHHYYRPQNFDKIAGKKNAQNIIEKNKNFIFFDLASQNVSRTLLRGRETIRKKKSQSFWDILKIHDFFRLCLPVRPSSHPSILVSLVSGTPVGCTRLGYWWLFSPPP